MMGEQLMPDGAYRDTNGKLPWGLVDFEAMRPLASYYNGWHKVNWYAMEELVRVLAFGAQKYAPNNWKKGLPISSVANSLVRHILKLIRGERFDEESGLSHYGHILCNLMFISYYIDHRKDLDDRFKSDGTTYSSIRLSLESEQDALRLLLDTVGVFMNGTDYSFHLLGLAMHYACEGYKFQYQEGCPKETVTL